MKPDHRYVMKIAYLGTNYSGWQIQDNADTIQGSIVTCLRFLLKQEISLIVGVGRTDAGVHAVNFFSHFDYFIGLDTVDILFKLNKCLPNDIVIQFIQPISSEFHARFSAISRGYEYWITRVKDPFLINRAYFFYKKLDIDLMNEGVSLILGEHDFSAFSKSKYDNPICLVNRASWIQSNNMLIFSINSNRFLHNMVRCLVGTFINLGLNKITLIDFKCLLNSDERRYSGYSVPACGLYLMQTNYPKAFTFENN